MSCLRPNCGVHGVAFAVPSLQGHMKAALQLDTVGVGFMFALIASMYITASAVSGWAGDRCARLFHATLGDLQ